MTTTQVVGFKGQRRSGKSTCSAALRKLAGSSSKADIEYSDPMIDAANFALGYGDFRLEQFGDALIEGAKLVTGQEAPRPEVGWRLREGFGAEVEFRLRDWLRYKSQSGLFLTRENKDEHRAVLMWLGINLRDLVTQDYWANEIDRRIERASDEPLITASGVRFPEDTAPIFRRSGIIVEVTSKRVSSDDDPTNAKRDLIQPDTIVHNDSSIEAVEVMMNLLRRDLIDSKRTIALQYYPS